MGKYALYQNKVYPVNFQGQVLCLTSKFKENGFNELIDIVGNRHDDIFIKEVSLEDVLLVYELKMNAIYKGKEFETYGVDSSTLEKNYILLFSMDYEDVNDFGFRKHEQFVYQKEVALGDIDALVEMKKPILKWENQPESRRTIPNNKIRDYLSQL
ncbi:hypothetical protein [Bacillus timonensis]|uniref:hypothetical protein n=1 Tax=Bacillus timonensis TaxID=1033734 RepID=UPI0002884955|nr:hypothetical protein [Bacillus timonensis]